VNFSLDDLVGHKRYMVERLIRACEQGGSIRLRGLPVPGTFTKNAVDMSRK